MLHDFVEKRTLGEDEWRSWNISFHLLLVPLLMGGSWLCPAVGPEEVIAVKPGGGIHIIWMCILINEESSLCSKWAPELSQWWHSADHMDWWRMLMIEMLFVWAGSESGDWHLPMPWAGSGDKDVSGVGSRDWTACCISDPGREEQPAPCILVISWDAVGRDGWEGCTPRVLVCQCLLPWPTWGCLGPILLPAGFGRCRFLSFDRAVLIFHQWLFSQAMALVP